MDNVKNISVIGDGGWGTALAVLLSSKGYNVTLWGVFPEYIEEMKSGRINTKFLPGIKIPDEVLITSSLDEALNDKDIIVLAVPSQHMRDVLSKFRKYKFSKEIFVNVAKGIENHTLKCMSEVIKELLGGVNLVVLSGPTIAHEVAFKVPTAIVASSENGEFAKTVQEVFMTETFRVYTSNDVIGVELGGSLKNVIAIAAGISDGLKFGTNTKAALLTRGLVEMVRLGIAMGAKKETFYGLSGLGDLATTCINQSSRNRHFGEKIGRGMQIKDALKEGEMVVEGVATAQSAYELAKKYNIIMPITSEVFKIIYENKNPEKAVSDLMTRSQKPEG